MADKIDSASVSYTLGIVSIVMAFFTPMAGLIIGIIGLVKARREKADKAKKLNRIGIILSVIIYIIYLVFLAYSSSLGLNTGTFPF